MGTPDAAAAEPEALGWVEVLQSDTDLDGIGIGAMLSWECDLYVSEIIQTLARSGEALGAIEMMQILLQWRGARVGHRGAAER